MLFRSVLRTVRKSIGRYLTIFAIIALGVGFFAGLRVTQEAMIKTADNYVRELRFYDYRLVSTLGFTGEDVSAFCDLAGVEAAAGSVSSDCIVTSRDGADQVLHARKRRTNVCWTRNTRTKACLGQCSGSRKTTRSRWRISLRMTLTPWSGSSTAPCT